MISRIAIGLSGFSYKPWQGPGRFYPETLKSAEFLRYYAGRYTTVELDGCWYRLPSEKTVLSWIDQTPAYFLFAPKAHRQITHIHRLKPDALSFLRLMLDRLALLQEEGRLGPVLLQLPPTLRRNDDRLEGFLKQLPTTTRWAIEFREASWNAFEVETALRRHGVAWVAAETDQAPAEKRDTADFWYVRLRRSDYTEAALAEWANWVKAQVGKGKECFIFLKHEDEGAPWIWADRLIELTKT